LRGFGVNKGDSAFAPADGRLNVRDLRFSGLNSGK